MELGTRLQRLRRERGLSQEQVAQRIGVSRQAVSKWEADRSLPELEKLAALAKLYGATLDELAGTGEEAQPARPSPADPPAGPGELGRYEYVSRRRLFGLPLLHVNVGRRGVHVARGIVAVGNVACGIVSIGGASLGVISAGGLSFGLAALGGFALGGLTVGGLAVGLIAMGGLALGLLAMGGLAFGQVAAGGVALASHLAVGGYAGAPLAVGETARGAQTFLLGGTELLSLSRQELGALLMAAAPRYLGFAARLLAGLLTL